MDAVIDHYVLPVRTYNAISLSFPLLIGTCFHFCSGVCYATCRTDRDHESCPTVTSQTVLQQPGELAVPVRHVLLILFAQGANAVAEGGQRKVDGFELCELHVSAPTRHPIPDGSFRPL